MDAFVSDLEDVRAEVRALRTSGWRKLAEASRIPFSTIRKFAYGDVGRPRYGTVVAIKHGLRVLESTPKAKEARS